MKTLIRPGQNEDDPVLVQVQDWSVLLVLLLKSTSIQRSSLPISPGLLNVSGISTFCRRSLTSHVSSNFVMKRELDS